MVVYAQSQGITLALNVNFRIAYFDFSMTASPTSLEIATEYCCAQSATSTLTLTLAPLDAGQPVSFSAQGQPSYLQIGYNPSSVIPTNSVTVTFTVPAGGKIYSTRTYNIVITGSWTSSDQTVTISHSINVSVTIDQDCTRSYCFNKPPP